MSDSSNNNPPATPKWRTINDFNDDDDDLRLALMNMQLHNRDDCQDLRDQQLTMATDSEAEEATNFGPHEGRDQSSDDTVDDTWDWTLTNYDVEQSEPQTIAREVARLRNLQSYQIVGDTSGGEVFDRITRMAARVFNVPMISLTQIDIGRQWVLSNYGLGELRELPRNAGICQHTILHKDDILVIPNCAEDFRLRQSGVVLDPDGPQLKFYAGAALITPEGHKLGSICILDTKPHPQGLTDWERDNLLDFSKLVVQALVERRDRLNRVSKSTSDLVVSAAHDLSTHLTGLQSSLVASIPVEENSSNNSKAEQHHFQPTSSLEASRAAVDMMQHICTTTLETVQASQEEPAKILPATNNMEQSLSISSAKSDKKTVVNLEDCMLQLHQLVDPLPKQVPVVISVDPDVPSHIMANSQDGRAIVRACMTMVANACAHTSEGKILVRVVCRQNKHQQQQAQIVFECDDSRSEGEQNQSTTTTSQSFDCILGECGPSQSVSPTEEISKLALQSLTSQVQALGGKFGYRSHQQTSASSAKQRGVYVWFSIPLQESVEHIASENTKEPHQASVVSPEQPPNPTTNMEVLTTPVQPIHTQYGPKDLEMSDAVCRTADEVSPTKVPLHHLPTATHASPLRTVSSSTTCDRRQRAALVIEESMVVRNSLARALTKRGYEVISVGNGLDGLSHLQNRVFDITFCDLFLPKQMSGTECIRQYRQWERRHRPQFSQYIVGISTKTDPNDVEQAIQAGFDEYRVKPITTQVVAELCQGGIVQRLSQHLDQVFHNGCLVFAPKANTVEGTTEITRNASYPTCSRRVTRSSDEIYRNDDGDDYGIQQPHRKRPKVSEWISLPNNKQTTDEICFMEASKPIS